MCFIETIIIGGGLSGLFTAYTLQQANIPCLLLEAKPEFGGRITGSPADPDSDFSVDLGPTWFWSHQVMMKELLTRLHLDWFEQYSIGDALYQQQPGVTPRRIANRGGDVPSYRVKGGMRQLVVSLAGKIEPTSSKSGHAVTAVRKSEGKWLVTTESSGGKHTFSAKQLILALPPRLIVQYLTTEQYLSKEFVNSLQAQQTWMSGQAKFAAVYSRPFWRERGLAGQAFSEVGPLVEIHDGSSAAGTGSALFGFIGLPRDVRSQLSAGRLKSLCLEQLGALFGPEALRAKTTYVKDWGEDKWAASAQDVMEPPRHAAFPIQQYKKELQTLQLHLAASEFAPCEAGYLEGALLASDAAVKNVIRNLREVRSRF